MGRANDILQDMLQATTYGRDVLNHYFRKGLEVSHKHKAGLVTRADQEAEQVIFAHLRKKGYDFVELGEEALAGATDVAKACAEILSSAKKPVWILDPLDGTTNFVHGFDVFAISLGLYEQGRVTHGVIWAPRLGGGEGTVYTASLGQGAFKNGAPIRVSTTEHLKDALLATGFFHEDENQLQEQLGIFSRLVRQVRGIRRAGAASLDLAWVAEGIFDGFWEKGLKPWDTAAGILLVREAGGEVGNYLGHTYSLNDTSIITANRKIFDSLLKNMSLELKF